MTPPQIAERYGVSPDKVLAWIRAGELRAINIATKVGGRPRYAVDETDLLAFERGRQVKPPGQQRMRRRLPHRGDVIEFF
jgi:excisionase family DNA binding protein